MEAAAAGGEEGREGGGSVSGHHHQQAARAVTPHTPPALPATPDCFLALSILIVTWVGLGSRGRVSCRCGSGGALDNRWGRGYLT